jgi:hypothetical protein
MITIKVSPEDIKNAFVSWRLATVNVQDTEEFSNLLPEEKAKADARIFMQYLCETSK